MACDCKDCPDGRTDRWLRRIELGACLALAVVILLNLPEVFRDILEVLHGLYGWGQSLQN